MAAQFFEPIANIFQTQRSQAAPACDRKPHTVPSTVCARVFAMRRAQSILVIIALLATPLALVARTDSPEESQCSRMCCLVRRGHSAKPHRCICGVPAQRLQCAMKPMPHTPDYGLNAPMAPTEPSSLVSLAALQTERGFVVSPAQPLPSGFSPVPFQPPRS
jgi:hypothetical protein